MGGVVMFILYILTLVTLFQLFLYFKDSIATHLEDEAFNLHLIQYRSEMEAELEFENRRKLYELRVSMKYLPSLIKSGNVNNLESLPREKQGKLVFNEFVASCLEKNLKKDPTLYTAWQYAIENHYRIITKK